MKLDTHIYIHLYVDLCCFLVWTLVVFPSLDPIPGSRLGTSSQLAHEQLDHGPMGVCLAYRMQRELFAFSVQVMQPLAPAPPARMTTPPTGASHPI